jgi:hypothetical protein
MSIAHTWFGRSTAQVAQLIRMGSCAPAADLDVLGWAMQRLDPHPPHHRGHQLSADRNTFAAQQIAQHPATRKRVVQMQLIQSAA